jgi:ubiquinone/menaquinone biosynthesis C-methylase UbiE
MEGTMEAMALIDHPLRGRLNAWALRVMDGYLHARYREVKSELFGGLPHTVLEIGPGAGANLRYLSPGTHVIAVEPNVHMHPHLLRAATRRNVSVDLRVAAAEAIPLPDASVEAVIGSLVLCTVSDPARVLSEIRRVLRPGGRFCCVEHVAAPAGTLLALIQRLVARPWCCAFEGCHTHRDTARTLREAGFASVEVWPFTFRSALLPVRCQIAAVAVR